ncbi:hypothetical protein AB4Z52_33770 [Rhizobium sp. 2YAF20]|uniref:hypothetical protein n=1 Tax=Rhizobium sp. 2YAF20 TaxID=3233027 RepID=UPI003F9CF48D
MLVPLSGSANAQTIGIPAGELRLGMTEDEVTRLLQSDVGEGSDTDGDFHRRMVVAKIEDRTLRAIFTSKSVVYSISSQQSFPTGPVGKHSAEQAFQHYLKSYAAPTTSPIFRRPTGTGQGWTGSDGQIGIALICGETVLIVTVSDYQRELKDDGVSDEIQQRFREPLDNCF